MNYWQILGIGETDDKKIVKRAYATKLKITRPDDDAAAYQELREAYDWALKYGIHTVSSVVEEGQTDFDQDVLQADGSLSVEGSLSAEGSLLAEGSSYIEINGSDQGSDFDDANTELLQQWSETPGIDSALQPGDNHYQVAQEAVKKLFSVESEDQMIDLFRLWLIEGDISSLKVRSAFDEICFQRAIDDIYGENYPCALYRVMAEEFSWLTELHNDYFKVSLQEKLQIRFDAYSEYEILHEYYHEGSWYNILDSDNWVAKLLLGSLQPLVFLVLARLGIFNAAIRQKIKTFDNAIAYDVIPELQTPAFTWWQSYLSKIRLTLLHVLLGNIFAVSIINSWVVVQDHIAQIYFYLICMSIGTLLAWGLMILYQRTAPTDFYSQQTVDRSFFWYGTALVSTVVTIINGLETPSLLFHVGLLLSLWMLVGLAGFIHLFVIVVVITGPASAELDLMTLKEAPLIVIMIAVSCYFAFDKILPYSPSWLITSSQRSGFPHIIIVSIMTMVFLFSVTYLRSLF